MAQVSTRYKIGKLSMWTLFCNVCIDFLNSRIWMEIMLELNGKASSVTTFSTDFSFQNLVFGEFIWIVSGRNHLKNQYLPHSESKSYQISSIQSCPSRSFQQHQRHIPISPKFSATFYFHFQWRNHSIFKNFLHHKSKCHGTKPIHRPRGELSKNTKNTIWSILIWCIS